MEDEEPLEARTVVRQLAHSVQDQVDDFLADGVVTTGVVIRRVLLARDDLLRVVQLAVGASAHFVTHGRLQVNIHCAGHMFSGTSLGEEGVEGIVATADRLFGRHLPIGLDAMLEAVLGRGVKGREGEAKKCASGRGKAVQEGNASDSTLSLTS